MKVQTAAVAAAGLRGSLASACANIRRSRGGRQRGASGNARRAAVAGALAVAMVASGVQPASAAAEAGTWARTADMPRDHAHHSASLLHDGRVLVAGGIEHRQDVGYRETRSTELYEPRTGTWTPAPDMTVGRWAHDASVLDDGRVLVVGGGCETDLSDTEVYNLPTGCADSSLVTEELEVSELYDPSRPDLGWQRTGNLNVGRYMHKLAPLPGGKVLATGGRDSSLLAFTATAEIYDPDSGQWALTGSMSIVRANHTATLLPNGKVLVAGGQTLVEDGVRKNTATAEIFDPASGQWSPTGAMAGARLHHTATLLADGRVLVAGGYNGSSLDSAEIYDPGSGTWMATGSLNIARRLHTATLLPTGKVLVTGGDLTGPLASVEVYDPAAGTWSAAATMYSARRSHTATLLHNGDMLVAGGQGTDTLEASEVYRPSPPARALHPGDFDADGDTDLAVFRPSTGAWYVHGRSSPTFFGVPGDNPVAAYYDFDADTDIAVFRPANGGWYVHTPPATTFHGLSGDIPVPADYSGDGKVELAVFRPSNGGWYVQGRSPVYFGIRGDVPVTGDYAGDVAAEMAVFRSGAWYVEGRPTAYFGVPGDIPVPADYSGDGKVDLAVFRPSTGAWYVQGQPTAYFGIKGDVPVPGDYDANGTADIAVFRPANGGWYRPGQPTVYYGRQGDIPAALPYAIYQAFFVSPST